MGKFKDLTGKRFGRWTVVHRAEDKVLPSGQRKVMWHCICECKNEKDVSADNLNNGSSRSCGCLHKNQLSQRNFIDLTGKQFGKWTVLYRSKSHITPSGQQKTMWHCRCECGTERDVDAYNLTGGLSKSCGCLQQETSRIDVSKRIYDNDGNIIKKFCPSCQQFIDISLFSKNKRRSDSYNEYCNNCLKYDLHKRYLHYKSNAKNRKLSFEISLNEFKDITTKPCVYCGEYSTYFNNIGINGIDRIDSTKGYIKDNIVSCCEMCNRMKLNYDVFQWIEKIKKIAYRAQKGLIYEPKD